ncbi:cytochrome c biogenesis protein CcdA [uncultured Meiothermus sp.]|jgi:cytochrome c biogenesis protein CcdA|uniref:cytochrome c biogenesis CcdA family protein n=1 Tax=uncultured Meiothermus sp. TaxID=157471 RepID=UPI0026253983|nr:cytochrome c biogenesis protein CcdA [uncultured Meiothermus sp.]
MDPALFAYAFGVGVLAFFTPCSYAMLSAYVAHYFSQARRQESAWQESGIEGIKLGLAMSAGFFTVFAGLGLIIMLAGRVLSAYLSIFAPQIETGIALLLMGLGLTMLIKKGFTPGLPVDRITARLRGGKRPSERSLHHYYLYGISYAVGSLGCGLPLFLSVTLTAFTTYWLSGLANFFAYAGGMTLMMLTFSLSLVFANELIRRYFQKAVRYLQPVSGLALVVLGGYLFFRA